jgi:hypothetical protein
LGVANELHRRLKASPSVLDCLRFDEHIPEVIGHHPLGSVLGWIDAHDGEPLTANFLNARPDDAIRLLQALLVP